MQLSLPLVSVLVLLSFVSSEKMSGLLGLKLFVNQRLTAALQEIFDHVDRTVTEYEEELLRRWRRTDTEPLHQQRRPILDQEDPEPTLIKQELEEPERPWTHQAVKNETDGALEPARTSDPDGHLEPVRQEEAVRNHSDDQKETGRNNSGLKLLINDANKWSEFSDRGERFRQNQHTLGQTEEKLFSCSICGRRFKQKLDLVHHVVHHTQQNLFCDPNFTKLYQLENHTSVAESSQLHRTLTEPQPSSSGGLMRTGADEQPYRNLGPDGHLGPVLVRIMTSPGSSFETQVHVNDSGSGRSNKCSSFPQSDTIFGPRMGVRGPTEPEPLSRLFSNKGFSWRRQLKRRTRTHTEERTSAEPAKDSFICPECGRRFACKSYLKGHMRIHSGDARNSCSLCGKCFVLRSHLKEHMRSHTGERPFTCQLCNKSFKYSGNLGKHVKIHLRQVSECPTEH